MTNAPDPKLGSFQMAYGPGPADESFDRLSAFLHRINERLFFKEPIDDLAEEMEAELKVLRSLARR